MVGQGEELRLRVPEHLAEGAIHALERAVGPLDGHAGRGVLERPPEAGLALAEGCLRVLAHLPEHEHEGHRASVAPHGGADFGRELAAVLAPADGLPALRPGRELARRQTAATGERG